MEVISYYFTITKYFFSIFYIDVSIKFKQQSWEGESCVVLIA